MMETKQALEIKISYMASLSIRDAHLAAEVDDDEGSLFPATEATSSSMSTSEQSSCKLSS